MSVKCDFISNKITKRLKLMEQIENTQLVCWFEAIKEKLPLNLFKHSEMYSYQRLKNLSSC